MMPPDRDELERRWLGLWGRLHVAADRTPSLDRLIAAYDDPAREYHNLCHIDQCLKELDRVRDGCAHPDLVELAVWYHDAVYDSTRHDNEGKSADLAAKDLRSAGLPEFTISAVVEFIHATKHTHPPITPDAQILVDIDLSILGQDPETFDAYERAIRQEYAHVEDNAFRAGRASILERFLARPILFSTPSMRDRYEHAARQNLGRSLARLRHRA